MVQCYLSRLMGERRVRIADVARATGISRNQLARLYYDRARRVELADLEQLCRYFNCGLSDLLEVGPDPAVQPAKLRRERSLGRSGAGERRRRDKRPGGGSSRPTRSKPTT